MLVESAVAYSTLRRTNNSKIDFRKRMAYFSGFDLDKPSIFENGRLTCDSNFDTDKPSIFENGWLIRVLILDSDKPSIFENGWLICVLTGSG